MVGRQVEPKALTHRPGTTTRNRTGNQTHTHTLSAQYVLFSASQSQFYHSAQLMAEHYFLTK